MISLRVAERDYIRLKAMADKYDTSVSNAVRQLLAIAVRKLE